MRTAAAIALFVLAALCAAMPARSEPPTRETAVELLATYDEAYITGDLDDLNRLVEEDARFSTTLWYEGEMEQVIVNRKRYFKAAEAIWRSTRPNRPKREIVDVTISPDGQEITVVSEVVIVREIDGRMVSQNNRDVFLFVADGEEFRLRRHEAETRL